MHRNPHDGLESTKRRSAAFTVVELVVVIVVLGLLAAVALPHMGDAISSSKRATTRREMQIIIGAIVGDGSTNRSGYENDLGQLPPDLAALLQKPEDVPGLDRFTGLGWNGPYLQDNAENVTTDAWQIGYEYDSLGRTLTSNNPDSTIVMSF